MSAYADLLHVAVDDALWNHSELRALVGDRIFSEMAPEKTPLPYIRYGSTTELGIQRFGSSGSRGEKVIDVFGTHKMQVLEVYRHIHAALDGVRFVVGGTSCVGRVNLVGTVPDEVTGAHAVVQYLPRVK